MPISILTPGLRPRVSPRHRHKHRHRPRPRLRASHHYSHICVYAICHDFYIPQHKLPQKEGPKSLRSPLHTDMYIGMDVVIGKDIDICVDIDMDLYSYLYQDIHLHLHMDIDRCVCIYIYHRPRPTLIFSFEHRPRF